MSKQSLVVIVAAIALLGLGVFGAVAFTGGSAAPMMTMPDGTTMPSSDMNSTGPMSTMQDGGMMDGMGMSP